jgi:putative FmdB family regulatory protein
MSLFEYLCDSCGSVFDVEMETAETDAPVECPLCHSHDTQVIPTLSSVYGYSHPATSGCGGEDSEFR